MNKLIIFINLTGSYKGGAQRRYINLFKELQNSHNDYYLLINKSLYKSCIADGVLVTDKNIIVLQPLLNEISKPKSNISNETAQAQSQTKSRFRIVLGKNKYFFKQLVTWFFFNISLFKIIRKFRIKIVYSVFAGGINSWLLLKIMRINLIYGYNDSQVSRISKKWIDFFSSEYWPLKFSNKIDFLSKDVVESLNKKGVYIDPEKILITPNSFIDYLRFYPVYPKKPIITFCSRLTKIKNPDLFLDSIILLKDRGADNFNVAIIGEGVLLDSLKVKAKKNRLNNVTFYGGLSNPEKVLSQSLIFVSIQKYNNYPSQSLIEAMACENAIIVSDVGETRLLVTEKEGLLIDLNAEEIANAIEKLFTTPGLIEKLGKNARKKVIENHTIEKFANYFYSITNI